MLQPNYCVDTIYNLDYDKLYIEGIRIILFDIDNTIMPYKNEVVPEELPEFMENLKKKNFMIGLLSNSKVDRVLDIGKQLNLPAVGMAKKPFKGGFNRILGKFKTAVQLDEVLLVGDQVVTDLIGAKRMGIKIALVDPITKVDLFATKLFRLIEKPIRRGYVKENMIDEK